MSITVITMPQLGETVTEGTITRWLKRVGEWVDKYEPFAEVATDKVNAEIPATVAGYLLQTCVREGEVVPTGSIIAYFGPTQDAPVPNTAPHTPLPLHADNATSTRNGSSLHSDSAPTSQQGQLPQPSRESSQRYSPAVRRALREHKINPSTIRGTGLHGRLTLHDVLNAVAGDRSTSPAQLVGFGQRIPLTRARRAIADHLTHAVQTIPHAWTMIEVDASALVALRNRDREQLASLGLRTTYFHYFCWAVVNVLKRHPLVNAHLTDDTIVIPESIDVCFAVALNGNLVVPVVHNAHRHDFFSFARAMSDVTERARTNRLRLEELRGGTITLNNTGANGSLLSAPIINGGQAAILTMEGITRRPVVVNDDAIAIRPMMNVCCSIDHRILDGDTIGACLRDIKAHIENMTSV